LAGFSSSGRLACMAGKKLQGQVAIVTGGGRGIDAAAGELLARAGASVVLVARTEEEVEAVAARIREEGRQAIAVTADVADPDSVEEIVESAVEQFGRVDILVNNAGVIWPLEAVALSDIDEWTYSLHTNLIGPFYLCRNLLPLMIDQGYGRIVNVSSAAADVAIAGGSAYCVSKAGLNMLTRTLALEVAEYHITVNSVDPGEVDTEMQADIRSIDEGEFGFDISYFRDLYEQGKLRPAAEAAQAIYWLAGPWSVHETGKHFSLRDDAWRARLLKDLA
jgi:NAD(P)-dependent dehydrogenase (short-subunit alcohol dehydrogenase family)